MDGGVSLRACAVYLNRVIVTITVNDNGYHLCYIFYCGIFARIF